jgi:hypothetical protein
LPRAPIERLVTPSLAQLGPERLAEVVRAYREELRTLAERHAYHACAWALEAIDSLVADNVRLQRAAERLGELHPASTRGQERLGEPHPASTRGQGRKRI